MSNDDKTNKLEIRLIDPVEKPDFTKNGQAEELTSNQIISKYGQCLTKEETEILHIKEKERTTMNYEKFLRETIFTRTELAARLYPELTRGSAKNRLHSKMNHVPSSTGTRNLTVKDKERLKEIWEQLKRDIDGDIEE